MCTGPGGQVRGIHVDMAFLQIPELLLKELHRKSDDLTIPPAIRARLDRVKAIFAQYPDLVLSNRQVFYQFVRRGWCENTYND
jgi:hypothetical protein